MIGLTAFAALAFALLGAVDWRVSTERRALLAERGDLASERNLIRGALAERDQEIVSLRAAQAALAEESSAYRSQVLQTVRAVEGRLRFVLASRSAGDRGPAGVFVPGRGKPEQNPMLPSFGPARADLGGLVEAGTALETSLAQLREGLERSESERANLARSRDGLMVALRRMEDDVVNLRGDREALDRAVGQVGARLAAIDSERREAAEERDGLSRMLALLQDKLSSFEKTQREAVGRLLLRTAVTVEEMENALAKTGVNVKKLLGDPPSPRGLGGPFVAWTGEPPVSAIEVNLSTLDRQLERYDELQRLLRALPIAPPLESFTVQSVYGKRNDPINGKPSMHSGIDLSAPPRAPVLSPAPGKVRYAGHQPDYGNMVEIDHGHGVVTRYAHLHQIKVRAGRDVGFKEAIGTVGSTGRTTGPHLHYEVVVDGKPQDPMRFLDAGRFVLRF